MLQKKTSPKLKSSAFHAAHLKGEQYVHMPSITYKNLRWEYSWPFFCCCYFRKLCSEETVASLKLVSQEVLFTSWMVEQLLFVCDDKKIPQLSSNENLPEVRLPPSSGVCYTLLCPYIQLSILLWKRVWNENSGLLLRKIIYVTHVTVKLYEQSSTSIQKYIADVFSSSAKILLLCCQIAITAIKGMYLFFVVYYR